MRSFVAFGSIALTTLLVACSDGGTGGLVTGAPEAPRSDGGSPSLDASAPSDPGSGPVADDAGDPASDPDAASLDAAPTDDASPDAAPPPPPSPDAGPPSSDVFTGAGAFTSKVDGATHNAGRNCMGGCHNHGFTFAGTLTDGKGNAVAGAEVRLVDAKGVGITVHTGPTGNFHSSTPFTAPAHVGARDATHVVTMVTALQSTQGGCNGCHATGGTTTPIHLP